MRCAFCCVFPSIEITLGFLASQFFHMRQQKTSWLRHRSTCCQWAAKRLTESYLPESLWLAISRQLSMKYFSDTSSNLFIRQAEDFILQIQYYSDLSPLHMFIISASFNTDFRLLSAFGSLGFCLPQNMHFFESEGKSQSERDISARSSLLSCLLTEQERAAQVDI